MKISEDIITFRYWNSNNTPVAIVAVKGSNNDFAVYIGGDNNPNANQEDTLNRVKRFGAKLMKEEGLRFLPELNEINLNYRG